MKLVVAALTVAVLFFGAWGLAVFETAQWAALCVLPYVCLVVFVGGVLFKVLRFAASPVPFRITVTAGQQKSLSWIRPSILDNPSSRIAAAARVALDALFFRTLLRETRMQRPPSSQRTVYATALGLWFFALMFHASLTIVFLRHLRFFIDPVPAPLFAVLRADGFFGLTTPAFFITGGLFVVSGVYLLGRRIWSGRIRYLSSVSDYFFILLLIGIGISGVLLRYVFKTDISGVKEAAMGVVAFSPRCPVGLNALFYGHIFLVMCLFVFFPFSKLIHGFGLLFSPTRNMRADGRAKRHLNPWNDPSIQPRSYAEYEDEFRDKMKAAHIPVEKD